MSGCLSTPCFNVYAITNRCCPAPISSGVVTVISIPKCLSLPSQIFLEMGSRFFRIARTTTSKTAIPIVSKAPVKSAANGRIDKAPVPSAMFVGKWEKMLRIYFLHIHVKYDDKKRIWAEIRGNGKDIVLGFRFSIILHYPELWSQLENYFFWHLHGTRGWLN